MDLKIFTKHLIDVSTPQMLKDWIKAFGNKVEKLEFSVQSKDKKIVELEAENRRLKRLKSTRLKDKSNSG